jgi:hypothetical protein
LAIVATIKGSGEMPAVLFLSYLQIVLGLLVFAIGITQIIHGLSTGKVKSRKND